MNDTYAPTLPNTIDVRALAVAICEQVEALTNPLYFLTQGQRGIVRLAGLAEAFTILTGNTVPDHEHDDEEHGCQYMQAIVEMAIGVAELDTLTATLDEPPLVQEE